MRIRRESYGERVLRLRKWHRWFAWFPVEVDDRLVWLCFVERRTSLVSLEDHGGMVYEYRLIESKA